MRLFSMKKLEAPNIGIAVYNEGRNIEKTMKFFLDSLRNISFRSKPHIYICFNGCTDNTISSFLNLFSSIKKIFSISVLSSKKGKLKAHHEIISSIHNNKPIIFLDSDIFVTAEVIKKLVSSLQEDKKLKVVSAYPYVIKPENINFYQRFIFSLINLGWSKPKIPIE